MPGILTSRHSEFFSQTVLKNPFQHHEKSQEKVEKSVIEGQEKAGGATKGNASAGIGISIGIGIDIQDIKVRALRPVKSLADRTGAWRESRRTFTPSRFGKWTLDRKSVGQFHESSSQSDLFEDQSVAVPTLTSTAVEPPLRSAPPRATTFDERWLEEPMPAVMDDRVLPARIGFATPRFDHHNPHQANNNNPLLDNTNIMNSSSNIAYGVGDPNNSEYIGGSGPNSHVVVPNHLVEDNRHENGSALGWTNPMNRTTTPDLDQPDDYSPSTVVSSNLRNISHNFSHNYNQNIANNHPIQHQHQHPYQQYSQPQQEWRPMPQLYQHSGPRSSPSLPLSNSSSPRDRDHTFPPRADSRTGSHPQLRRPAPPTSHPSSLQNSPVPPKNDWRPDHQYHHHNHQQPHPNPQHHAQRHPIQRQYSHPHAPPRRSQSPGYPIANGSKSLRRKDHDRSQFDVNMGHHSEDPQTQQQHQREHITNGGSSRSSPVPFEHNSATSRNSPAMGHPGPGGYQNQQPKGLRIRTGTAPSQYRPGPMYDSRTPTDRSGKTRDDVPRAPIIQMPLAFNSLATRQESSRTNSPTAVRSPTTGFDSNQTRPRGRRPTIIREEAIRDENSLPPLPTSQPESPVATRPEISGRQTPSSQRKPSPSPPNMRAQSPILEPGNFTESPSAIRSSFRTALTQNRQDGTRSSVMTNDSGVTTSASETGETGEMSVEDAIGMYESDDDDYDPTEVPVVDRTKRTDSGTPVEPQTRRVPMSQDRMSRSGLADFLIQQREEVASPASPSNRESGVSLVLQNGVNLEEELQDAQLNEWDVITDKRKSAAPSRAESIPPLETSDINKSAPGDTPPKNPPMAPTGTAPRDRYGFRTETQYITAAEYKAWNGKYEEILIRRKKKWQGLLKESGLVPADGELPVRFPPRSQKVKRFVRKGVPPEWRGNAWWFYANGQKYLSKNPGLYEKLVAQGSPSDSEAPELIERDLHRTHPDNIHFKPEQKYPLVNGAKLTKHKQSNSKIVETPIVQSLRRVLTAFAIYVPRIGYCQSLNFWAGMLLLFMNEEKAFWMLYIITHQYLPGTHERSLEGSNIDQAVLMMSVKEAMPAVWSKISMCLDGTTISFNNSKLPDITLCTASWLMSGFISNLPIETVLRVWDSFFYEGSKILFRISLALFKIAEPAIKSVNDPVEVFQIVQTAPRKCIDAGALMDLCFKRRNGYGHLSQQVIDERRKERKELLERERKALNDDGTPSRNSKDDLALRKGFARELLEEGEEGVRRFRNFIKR